MLLMCINVFRFYRMRVPSLILGGGGGLKHDLCLQKPLLKKTVNFDDII
jgi:hypothetical protein